MVVRAAATALLLCLLACSPALAADRDRDRMPDSWERKHHVKKARGDQDRDGLRNRDEYRARTNPRRRDSDGDGLRDGDEIRFGWHPRRRDTDRDGIRDGRENAGVVTAVSGLRVTIKLARGERLRGRLEDPQALACVAVSAPGEAPAGDDAGWLPEGGEAGAGDDAGFDDALFWDPAWGEQPADLDGDIADDESPLRLAQVEEDEPSSEDGEFFADDEAEDPVAEESPVSEQCRAALKVGALVHEAASELGSGGRRLTRLRLVT